MLTVSLIVLDASVTVFRSIFAKKVYKVYFGGGYVFVPLLVCSITKLQFFWKK